MFFFLKKLLKLVRLVFNNVLNLVKENVRENLVWNFDMVPRKEQGNMKFMRVVRTL